jgi:hypothetical protein
VKRLEAVAEQAVEQQGRPVQCLREVPGMPARGGKVYEPRSIKTQALDGSADLPLAVKAIVGGVIIHATVMPGDHVFYAGDVEGSREHAEGVVGMGG